jgi:hypothetical protein
MKRLLATAQYGLALGLLLMFSASSLYSQDVQIPEPFDAPETSGSQIIDNATARRISISRMLSPGTMTGLSTGTGTVTAPTGTAGVPPASSETSQQSQDSDAGAKNAPYVFPTHSERFMRFVKNTVGPFRLARTAIAAGIDQWRDHPEEWEQGSRGYAKRFASSFGKNVIHQSVTYALDEALGLDTGFRRSRRTGFWPRATDALLENVTSRNREGKRVVSVPRFAGVYLGAIIPYETWYPSRYDYKRGLRSGTGTLLIDFGFNLVREFLIKF